MPGTKLVSAFSYGRSLWGSTAKIRCRLPDESRVDYLLKVPPLQAVLKILYAPSNLTLGHSTW